MVVSPYKSNVEYSIPIGVIDAVVNVPGILLPVNMRGNLP
jgi:hypothetical protein